MITEIEEMITVENLAPFFRGDTNVASLCVDLYNISHIWDDLIDKDKEISDQDINMAFIAALVSIPSNPFFAYYREQLVPLILNTALTWQSATKIERHNNKDHKVMAFIFRNTLPSVYHYCLYLVGGMELVEENGAKLTEFISQAMDNRFNEFMQEFPVKEEVT